MQGIRLAHVLFERDLSVGGLSFSPDGSTLATTGGYRGNAIRLWNCEDWIPRGKLQGHWKSPMYFAFAGRTDMLVSCAFDKQVKAWDCDTLSQLAAHAQHQSPVTAVTCDEEGARAVSGDKGGCIFSWRLEDFVRPVLFANVDGRVNSLAFSPEGHVLASGGGIERQSSQVHIWDAESARLIKSLGGHSDWVLWVGFAKDEALMATASYGEICLWQTESWKLLQVLKRPDTERFSTIAFSFSSDKEVFISGGWSHEDDRHEIRDPSGTIQGWNVKHKGLIQFWDLTSGTLNDCIEAHSDSIRCLACNQKEDLVASGSTDGVIKIWRLEPR